MSTNHRQGEVEIILDGISYILRPTFDALSAIERELSTGLITLAGKMAEGNITLEEMAVIVTRSLQAGVDMDFIKEALVRNGIAHCVETVAAMLAIVLGGFNQGHDH